MAFLLRNISIRTKMLAAYALLVVCLVILGANAYFTITNMDVGLNRLSTATLPKQLLVSRLKDKAVAAHVGIFRYVSWASNGVDSALLEGVNEDVFKDIDASFALLSELAEPKDLVAAERDRIQMLQGKWKEYEHVARDTIDVGSVDAPMATMMLGMVDDEFKVVAENLDSFFLHVADETRSFTGDLASEASARKRLLIIGGLLAVLVSLFVALVLSRSIVGPIQAITNLMQDVSSGKLDVEIDDNGRKDEIGKMVRAVAAFRETIERDNRLLKSREEELRLRNMHFNAALKNMSQGLNMWDANSRLVLSNQRYFDMYRIPPDAIRAGMSFEEVIEFRKWMGVDYGDVKAFTAKVMAALEKGEAISHIIETDDGRVINVINRPMPGGGWVATHDDVTERHRAEEKIALMARQDALTSLANRLTFLEEVEGAFARLKDRAETFAVFVLDLDQFKAVNDTLGHPVGDALLIEIGKRLRDCAGARDTVARFGGDEFAILQATDGGRQRETAARLARDILNAVNGPYLIDGNEVVVTTSIGIAIAPEDGATPDHILKKADLALYKTKSEGRKGYRFFDPVMAAETRSRRSLAADLGEALSLEQIDLHYQAITDLGTCSTCGVEALARWTHPVRGPISPGTFIALAEETGMILELGGWLLRKACADAMTLPAHIKVAVNLSPVQFRDPKLFQVIEATLAQTGLAPERLEVEVTESVLLQQNEENLATLHALRELGASVVLDDFGTGYSSLTYLQEFPFDKIKIDRSFVSKVQSNADCAAIVKAVTGLARSLQVTTVAEGVEAPEQLDFLRAVGCHQVQGYLFSHPVPLSKLDLMLPGRGRRWTIRAKTA
ncbi:EAL domain-containing protein [Roseibium aggregatum]|uniref:EAL domain-containing protein n=1 Tax=Roseibium aggregatum TaxID=187304 RepID=A0A926NZU1_9HYPH|nr:EAL domain-containing protein [Roseibium aggregatum]MBD1547155.1 EAL domain-containing protein [Roseibium aggregatum]